MIRIIFRETRRYDSTTIVDSWKQVLPHLPSPKDGEVAIHKGTYATVAIVTIDYNR